MGGDVSGIVTAQVITTKMQWTFGNQLRIELTDSSGGRITGIGKQWLASLGPCFVESAKLGFVHNNLTPNFSPAAQKVLVTFSRMQTQWYRFNGAYISRDVFTDKTVTTRNGPAQ